MPLDVLFRDPVDNAERVITYPDANPPERGGICHIDGVGWVAVEIAERSDGTPATVEDFCKAKMRERGK